MGLFGSGGSTASVAHIKGCYTSESVPGRTISKSFGLVEVTQKGVAGDIPERSETIFNSLLSVAEALGANAVVNVRVVTGSYQQQGSGWQYSYVIAYGDAVILA
ncbi:heavy metal-binding domain-containing protein [Oceanisphaera pacifica]|uniref:Heavy metal-binding domain-containing protein n=1 Tax=Oceanisphaera pacifica TaxID=2818389 RepID=A0ABS3NE36_9GAMM|nr:heavy metal-binding domain-containing protein [Oceanisphaera pacifica]MBO1518810.1 heavy metal-binding domain-containing protein [Oceanisphaera pacifica]